MISRNSIGPRSRCGLALLTTAVLAAATGSCSKNEDENSSRASALQHCVVMISLDTTRRDHLSVYAYDRPTSPNLEALAKDSLVMQNFLTTSSWTLPTHASLFTGLFPSSHGAHYSNVGDVALGDADGAPEGFEAFRANRLPDQAITLAEVLREHGYQTHAITAGPWFKPVFGLGQGFDHYDAEFKSLAGRRGDEVSALALEFIGRTRRQPFFLFLNYFDPHDPYDPHGTSWEQFLRPGKNFARSKELAHYDAEIRFMDQQIGRVVEALKARDLYHTSWIIVTSDHGEHFGEHDLEVHGFSLYEGVVQGALLIKPPVGISLAVDPQTRAQSVDVMPTLLDAMQISPPLGMEGQPLRAITHPAVTELYRSVGNVRWKGERFQRELRAIYADAALENITNADTKIDTREFKLIVSSREGDPDAGLFDLRADPGETHDVGAEHPEVLQSLTVALEHWTAQRHRLAPQAAGELDPNTRQQLEAMGYIDPPPAKP